MNQVEKLAQLMSTDTPWIWDYEPGNSVDLTMRTRWLKAAEIALKYCEDLYHTD